jgi:hypothetical protein
VSTGYWLLDRPNPNCPQRGDGQFWGYRTMLHEPSVIVVHTTESLADLDGPDSGAENVATWFATSTTAASYHTLIDSDSTVRCLPAGLDGTVAHTAFHAAEVNSWTLGLSFAMRADSWPTMPDWWYSRALNRAVNEAALWCARWDIPPVRTTLAAAQGGARGFLAHADVHPADRSDPGAGFPWDIFLRLVGAQLELDSATVTPTPQPPSGEENDTMPTHLLRLPSGAVIAAFATGLVRTIGGAEFKLFTDKAVPMLNVADPNEATQLTWQAHPMALDVRRIADTCAPAPRIVA